MASDRSAGILLHITSLPSRYGIGDLGPEAYAFADFLHESHQRYWQLLPLNPTSKSQGYSPYSATSAMAGNTLLISPDLLVAQGLLRRSEVNPFRRNPGDRVDFQQAETCRRVLLEQAWTRYRASPEFEEFKSDESWWLDDFALYSALKSKYRNRPWYTWPDDLRQRKPRALRQVTNEYASALEKTKWEQYLFFHQWSALRAYCEEYGIHLLGDLPFYLSHDSADVWAHPTMFSLNKDGSMKHVAGVPPDYFNADGQLWGMPVFRWNILEKDGYAWWEKRIRKNMQMFDKLRLDHFRAFSAYWEVPAGEKTAVRGRWKPGPGADLFNMLRRRFPELPFVAEDLGEITPDVYTLRDEYNLPGMKVLQFAFGDTMPASEHIPHHYDKNFFAYTGTHDNNTVAGWFRKEVSSAIKKQIGAYVGYSISQRNVHLALTNLLYGSVARVAILPMQDVLGLDERSRMNTPASVKGNWLWRLKPGSFSKTVINRLKALTLLYGRAPA